MTKYTVEVNCISVNGFKDTIQYDDVTFEQVIQIQKHYHDFYSYICEFKITNFKESF